MQVTDFTISLNASFSHSSNSSQTLTKMSSSRNGKRTSDCSFLQKPFLLEMLFMVLVMIVFQVSDVFVSKTSTHRVVRLDQGGGVSIKLWGSKSSISPAIGSSIEAKCLKVAWSPKVYSNKIMLMLDATSFWTLNLTELQIIGFLALYISFNTFRRLKSKRNHLQE